MSAQDRLSAEEAINAIREADGLAVLARPHTRAGHRHRRQARFANH
ncbi:MAG: hypothetical protein R3C45_18300 [Phycisphaerales bacterium]